MRFTSFGVVVCISLGGCSREPAAAPAATTAPKPLVSGIDRASFDTATRPQDDLFKHVNGGWLAKTEIPADKSSWGSFDMLVDKSQTDLRAIVEGAAKAANKAPGSDAQKIGDFFDSFMDEARVEQVGLTPLQSELAAIDRMQTKTDLARYFGRAFKLNSSTRWLASSKATRSSRIAKSCTSFRAGSACPIATTT